MNYQSGEVNRLNRITPVFLAVATALAAACSSTHRDRSMDGEWAIEIRLDHHRDRDHPPRAHEATGKLVVSDRLPDFPIWAGEISRTTSYAVGRYFVDLG